MNRLRLASRFQVSVEVCTPKAVDRLLGVADHDQARVRILRLTINFGKRAVLPGVGILKLIDQGDGKLLSNGGGKSPVRGLQCVVETLQQIREVELRQLVFGTAVRQRHVYSGMVQQVRCDIRFRLQVQA